MLKDKLDTILLFFIAFSFTLNMFNFGVSGLVKKYLNIFTLVILFGILFLLAQTQLIINLLLLILLVLTLILMFKLPIILIYVSLLVSLILSFILSLLGVDQLVSYLSAISFLLFAGIIFRNFFYENV